MTCVTPSTSMPRAATSVATSTSTLPVRNARSACSRAPWPRSPCTAAAAKPRSVSSSATWSRGALGAAEDDGQPAALGLQDAGEQLDLVHRVRAVDVLLDRVDGGRLVVGVGRADVRRLAHVAAGQVDDDARHGGREQHRLPVVGRHREDALDVGQEAQVEHLVGLVEDEHLDVRRGRGGAAGPGRCSRPGVPTTTSTPVRSASTCGSYARPP